MLGEYSSHESFNYELKEFRPLEDEIELLFDTDEIYDTIYNGTITTKIDNFIHDYLTKYICKILPKYVS